MAARKNKSILRTHGDIKKAWQKLEAEIAKHRKEREGRGDVFVSLTLEEFEAKLKRVNSPMIAAQSWPPSAPPGGTISYWSLIVNYDVLTFTNLALVIFIGNRNPIVSNDLFLSGFDPRFPTYAQGAPKGFSMTAAQYGFHAIDVTIPMGVEKTGYFGNVAIEQISLLGVGTVIERACFFFDVV
jgi:hypothetical protein